MATNTQGLFFVCERIPGSTGEALRIWDAEPMSFRYAMETCRRSEKLVSIPVTDPKARDLVTPEVLEKLAARLRHAFFEDLADTAKLLVSQPIMDIQTNGVNVGIDALVKAEGLLNGFMSKSKAGPIEAAYIALTGQDASAVVSDSAEVAEKLASKVTMVRSVLELCRKRLLVHLGVQLMKDLDEDSTPTEMARAIYLSRGFDFDRNPGHMRELLDAMEGNDRHAIRLCIQEFRGVDRDVLKAIFGPSIPKLDASVDAVIKAYYGELPEAQEKGAKKTKRQGQNQQLTNLWNLLSTVTDIDPAGEKRTGRNVLIQYAKEGYTHIHMTPTISGEAYFLSPRGDLGGSKSPKFSHGPINDFLRAAAGFPSLIAALAACGVDVEVKVAAESKKGTKPEPGTKVPAKKASPYADPFANFLKPMGK